MLRAPLAAALVIGHCALVIPSAAATAAEGGAFGARQRHTSALIGIFYDLKQTQRREPADGGKRFSEIVDEFVVSGFDEALLNRYYRAPLPLYTTQIAMPRMSAEEAPKAFGVEDEVKPRAWVVHYKGQVAPPADGAYRFIGRADDLMIVAIDRKVVLNGSLPDTRLPKLGWQPSQPPDHLTALPGKAHYGDWIELKAGDPVDLDILVGERPGGVFYAHLLVQRRDQSYPSEQGRLRLPLFQVAEKPDGAREYLTTMPVWTCFE